jgi:hypothetical protein
VQPERDADHSPPSNVKVKNESELYFPLPLVACIVCCGTALLYFTLFYCEQCT